MKSKAIPSRVKVLPLSGSRKKTSPALIMGPQVELATGVKVIVVGPERGHWLANTTEPAGFTTKLW